MVRQTQHHQWPVPEAADNDYHETFDELVDRIDIAVVVKGTIDNRPTAGIDGRWYLSTDEDPPTFYYDTGDEWVSPAMFGDPPEDLAWSTEEETINQQWTFEEPIRGDITGSANTADEAAEAEEATNAQQVGGHTADEFARTEEDTTFYEQVTFTEPTQLNGARVEGGTVDLPRYSGGDPSNRQRGSMWFRSDRQP